MQPSDPRLIRVALARIGVNNAEKLTGRNAAFRFKLTHYCSRAGGAANQLNLPAVAVLY